MRLADLIDLTMDGSGSGFFLRLNLSYHTITSIKIHHFHVCNKSTKHEESKHYLGYQNFKKSFIVVDTVNLSERLRYIGPADTFTKTRGKFTFIKPINKYLNINVCCIDFV